MVRSCLCGAGYIRSNLRLSAAFEVRKCLHFVETVATSSSIGYWLSFSATFADRPSQNSASWTHIRCPRWQLGTRRPPQIRLTGVTIFTACRQFGQTLESSIQSSRSIVPEARSFRGRPLQHGELMPEGENSCREFEPRAARGPKRGEQGDEQAVILPANPMAVRHTIDEDECFGMRKHATTPVPTSLRSSSVTNTI